MFGVLIGPGYTAPVRSTLAKLPNRPNLAVGALRDWDPMAVIVEGALLMSGSVGLAAYRQERQEGSMNLLCLPTNGISSGVQLSEALFQCAQEAMHPHIPRRATEWFYMVTLLEMHVPSRDPAFRRVEEACWRMLLLYTVQDLAEHARSLLVVADLARMLNNIRHTQGRDEVLVVCDALQGVQRTYPQVFAHV